MIAAAPISAGPAILALVGLVLGAVILCVVVILFNRIIGPAFEIRRYSKDILEAGLAIASNLDGTDELERTRALTASVPQLGGAYAERLGRGSR